MGHHVRPVDRLKVSERKARLSCVGRKLRPTRERRSHVSSRVQADPIRKHFIMIR